MESWQDILVREDRPILEVMKLIDLHSSQFAIVVDEARRILGTVTDGDVRRGILHNVPLDAPVKEVMNRSPITASGPDARGAAFALMQQHQIHQVAVVDDQGHVTDVISLDDFLEVGRLDNWVVVMAGGRGTRLRPLTDTLPKPMLDVAGQPLLQHIVENLRSQGFHRLFLAVNYLAETIESHFGDGADLGLGIEYLREQQPLGTCGALSLLPEAPVQPLLVMNGDLITRIDFRQLLDFHRQHGAAATVCVREYLHEVPFGVVEVDGYAAARLDEKPVFRHLVNAGIYVLEPGVLSFLTAGEHQDMTDLLSRLIEAGRRPAVFPIHEQWRDVGRLGDLQQAAAEIED